MTVANMHEGTLTMTDATTAEKVVTGQQLRAAVHEITEDIRELDTRLSGRLDGIESGMVQMETRILAELQNGRK